MAGLTVTGKNLLLNELKNSSGYLAVYASAVEEDVKPVTWGAVSGGELEIATSITFDISAGATVTKVVIYDDAIGTNKYMEQTLTTPESFGDAGLYTLQNWKVII